MIQIERDFRGLGPSAISAIPDIDPTSPEWVKDRLWRDRNNVTWAWNESTLMWDGYDETGTMIDADVDPQPGYGPFRELEPAPPVDELRELIELLRQQDNSPQWIAEELCRRYVITRRP